MLPYYWSVIIDRIEDVQELSKVPDPSCHFFAFDICQGEGSSGNVGLIVRHCPINLKIEV